MKAKIGGRGHRPSLEPLGAVLISHGLGRQVHGAGCLSRYGQILSPSREPVRQMDTYTVTGSKPCPFAQNAGTSGSSGGCAKTWLDHLHAAH